MTKNQNQVDVVRAWKDPAYRASLNEAQLAQVPAFPSGCIEVPAAGVASVRLGIDSDRLAFSNAPISNTVTATAGVCCVMDASAASPASCGSLVWHSVR